MSETEDILQNIWSSIKAKEEEEEGVGVILSDKARHHLVRLWRATFTLGESLWQPTLLCKENIPHLHIPVIHYSTCTCTFKQTCI